MGGARFYANNGKLPVDGGDAVMISLMTSKERNLSRLWDSSGFFFENIIIPLFPASDGRLGTSLLFSVPVECSDRPAAGDGCDLPVGHVVPNA